MNKKTALIAIIFLGCLLLSACNSNNPGNNNKAGNAFSGEINTGMIYPVSWTYTVEYAAPGEATLISTAKIDPGWHLYSQHISDKGSPMVFTYDASPGYILVGGTEEGITKKEYDPYLEIEILYFENEATFKQKINVLAKEDFTITGTLKYSACLTQCVPGEEDFSFMVKASNLLQP